MEIEKRIVKHDDGSYSEIYHKKGDKDFWHREDGPAVINYNKDGSILYEVYFVNDNNHREYGPAYIEYDKHGSIRSEQYWVNEIFLTKEEWESQYGWKSKLKGTPMGEIFLTSN